MSEGPLRWLATPGAVELLIRKSRFLGLALPCPEEESAARDLARLRAEHPRANHQVFAWRRRDPATGRIVHRFDDDGEPGGTAGRPVLAALEGRGAIDALVVVVRYFGGIKLGAGGLVRAYGEAAGKALAAAELRPLIPMARLSVRLSFAQLSAVERLAAQEGLTIVAREFTADAQLTLEAPAERIAALEAAVRDLTGGAARIERS